VKAGILPQKAVHVVPMFVQNGKDAFVLVFDFGGEGSRPAFADPRWDLEAQEEMDHVLRLRARIDVTEYNPHFIFCCARSCFFNLCTVFFSRLRE
jgi:hypothetical protein